MEALMHELEDFLAQSRLFEALDQGGRERLLSCGYVATFPTGATLLCQGEEGSTVYMILSGRVSVEVESGQSRIALAELERGACVGEVSMLGGGRRTATVKATEGVEALAFARHRIERILLDYPGLRSRLETLVEGRARDAIEKIVGS
jgi:CRP-like cAMP-binding protein